MKIIPIKTHKITAKDTDIFKILNRYIQALSEESVVCITSKIIAICQNQMIPVGSVDKDILIQKEAQYYLPRSSSNYNVCLTISHNILAASSGIDESNGNGYYILWPENPQETANKIRSYLAKKFDLKKIGVIITDSKTTPLRWGVTGIAISHSGFAAINSYIGKKDLFGRKFEYEKVNVADSLAASAVFVMGEGDEGIPLGVITDISHIQFQDRNPTQKELQELSIDMKDDLYAPLLTAVSWKKGEK